MRTCWQKKIRKGELICSQRNGKGLGGEGYANQRRDNAVDRTRMEKKGRYGMTKKERRLEVECRKRVI